MIETLHLTKRYNGLTAVDNLTLSVPAGTIFGFIGPNGAGKTTTLRMLAGLLEPSSGSITLDGIDVSAEPEAAACLVGYMPDFFGVYEEMTAWEYLDFFARCYELPADRRRRVVNELLDLVDLDHKRDDFIENLSRGMRQRLCLAHALVHDPPILLLDEPASGLDPRARVEMRELLRELGRLNKTVVISSHILAELAGLCDTVGIIEKGELVAAGSVDEVAALARGSTVVRVALLRPAETRAAVIEALESYPGVITVFDDVAAGVELAFDGDDTVLAGLLQHLVQRDIPITGFSKVSSDLEDIFLRLTKGEVQ